MKSQKNSLVVIITLLLYQTKKKNKFISVEIKANPMAQMMALMMNKKYF